LRVAQALPVKALIAGTHTPAAIPALVHLTNPPARALDGEKFQLLCHAHLPKATNNYSEDVKCLACKGFTTEMRIPTGKGGMPCWCERSRYLSAQRQKTVPIMNTALTYLFTTVLGAMGVKSTVYQQQLDILNLCRRATPLQ
jgi:hypothetical protein